MRASHWFIATLRETPADAEVISHQLMLRSGMIRKLGSGLYSWLPLGLKILRKVENIVREEMNKSLALEISMPAIQPAELWQETGRWETFGGQLLTMSDSIGREYCFGPTHEEVITDIIRNELRSYKQLPVNFYQIQTKFRDELRPRFGVMRAREFLMKDAYSFHLSLESLQETYSQMYQTYGRIFDRLGLHYRAVEADTGAIGGQTSHEFQVLADSGEDVIFFSDKSLYAANVEQATSLFPPKASIDGKHPVMISIDTKGLKTIDQVSNKLNIKTEAMLKTLIVEGANTPLVALVLRGDDVLNELKAAKHPAVKSPLVFADDKTIEQALAPVGFLGPVGLTIPIIADHNAAALPSFVCGANRLDKHYQHAAWQRDANYTETYDLRTVQEGDISPDGKGHLKSCRGIEVGHIFQLGDKYAKAMKAQVIDEDGQLQTLVMGCYGLGISRIIAASIEQNHDERGIIWPEAIAPFQVVIIPVNAHKNHAVMKHAEKLYQKLMEAGIDTLLDDRDERPGVLFADSDLMGIPHRLVIGEKHLAEDCLEYKARKGNAVSLIPLPEVIKFFTTSS